MEETPFNNLSLAEKEALVKERGHLIEVEDFYSFFVAVYLLNQVAIKLFYDYSGPLIGVEEVIESDHCPVITEDSFAG